MAELKQELRSNSSAHVNGLMDSLESKDSRNSLRQRQVRISEIVTNNDGTRSSLKPSSPPSQGQNGVKGPADAEPGDELKERIDAYNKALGPNSYRTVLDDGDVEEIQGAYINELGDGAPDLSYDGNYRSSGSYQSNLTVDTRRHSTPRKTPASKS